MNEQSIFIAALEIDDVNERAVFIEQACGDNQEIRSRVNALLEEYERSGEFLRIPAVEQMKEHGAGQGTDDIDEDLTPSDSYSHQQQTEFPFLQPSSVPGSLGTLGHYEIQELIGRGGFGVVFKAFDQRLHRVVAIKVLMPGMADTSPARKRFLREARATAAIRQENIVSIYAVEDFPIPYLVMEYIDGKTLQQLIDEIGPFELPDILRVGKQIARGLEAAHRRELIHRDIKPANILVEAGTGLVKLVDFGLVRVADDACESQSIVIAGTPLYMSPEQARGDMLDSRTDLFSLGSVLYVLCTGRPPFRAPSPLAVLKRVVDDEPRKIQEIIPEIPNWLVALIGKLQSKDPAQRCASAQEVAELLDRENFVDAFPAYPPRGQRLYRQLLRVAIAMLLLVSSLGATEALGITDFRGTVIRWFTPEGTLVVEVEDPTVSVSIDGEQLVIAGAGTMEIRVKPGQHQVTASKDGEVLLQELVSISRDGRQVVRISRENKEDLGLENVPQAESSDVAEGTPAIREPLDHQPTTESDPLTIGSFWLGERTYRRGAYQGSTVHYELHVTNRDGDRFEGHVFDNGKGRNFAVVEGKIDGNLLTWTEKARGNVLTMQAKRTGDELTITFHGLYSNHATNQGDGKLTLMPPP